MAKYVKLADINYVAIIQAPVVFGLEEWATAQPAWQWLVDAMPDGTMAFSLGIAVATLFYDVLFRPQSRLRDFWHWLVDAFEVEWIHAGATAEQGELQIVAMIRFRRRIRRAKLWLRVYGCTHMGREPMERLHLIEEISDVPRGFEKRLQVATIGFPILGWDHTKQRGWAGGPDTVIGESSNVVSLELQGPIFTQRYRMFVEYGCHVGNDHTPHVTVISEDDDLFDPSENGGRVCRGW